MRYTIKESQLKQIIAESVKKVLKESEENKDEDVIIDVLTACSDSPTASLQFLEKKYKMLRNILNMQSFDEHDCILQYKLKDIITINLNGRLYAAYEVFVRDNNVRVGFYSMRKERAVYRFDGEFDADEISIPLEELRAINQQEYNKLVERFKGVLNQMYEYHYMW